MHWKDLTRIGKAAPSFKLRTPEGETVTRGQFRHRKHLVLVFAPETGAADLLAAFGAHADDFKQANAALYAVTPAAASATALPHLIDADEGVRRSYAAALPPDEQPAPAQPLIAIVDRYGALAYVGAGEGDSALDETLTRVWGLEYECPE